MSPQDSPVFLSSAGQKKYLYVVILYREDHTATVFSVTDNSAFQLQRGAKEHNLGVTLEWEC